VGLYVTRDDIDAFVALDSRGLQHCIGSSDTGCGTKEDFQATACGVPGFFPHSRQYGVRIRSARVHDLAVTGSPENGRFNP
jgi:hypothetical protein